MINIITNPHAIKLILAMGLFFYIFVENTLAQSDKTDFSHSWLEPHMELFFTLLNTDSMGHLNHFQI